MSLLSLFEFFNFYFVYGCFACPVCLRPEEGIGWIILGLDACLIHPVGAGN